MNTAEKLRFLADRVEDGLEFIMKADLFKINGVLLYRKRNYEKQWELHSLDLNDLRFSDDLKLKPQWEFTEDEKVILRNLPDSFRWIARHKSGYLTIHEYKPVKHNNDLNWLDFKEHDSLSSFKHLFQSIQWSDEEPCDFRRYL